MWEYKIVFEEHDNQDDLFFYSDITASWNWKSSLHENIDEWFYQ